MNPKEDKMQWTFADGTLTISGKGNMEGSPWEAHMKEVNEVVIEDGITSISGYAFQKCKKLSSVIIPNSVTEIGQCAFWDCVSLSSVTIPNAMTEIGKFVFWGCKSLTSVTIPKSVYQIGEGAFGNCTGLRSVTISGKDTEIAKDAFEKCPSAVFKMPPDHHRRKGKKRKMKHQPKMKHQSKIKNSTNMADGWVFYYMDNDGGGGAIYKARPDASEITFVAEIDFEPSTIGIKKDCDCIYLCIKKIETTYEYSSLSSFREGVDLETTITYKMPRNGKGLTEISKGQRIVGC